MASHYNDPKFSYPHYWKSRTYEHLSETMVLQRFLGSRRFQSVVDLGGGFGRLCPLLTHYSQHITLIEPALKQRQLAQKYLSAYPQIRVKAGSVQNPGLPPSSQDLVVLIRVAHHLSNLEPAFTHIHQALIPNGLLILEFANSLNFKARLRSLLFGLPIPRSPIDMRTPQNQNQNTIAFLNHHPDTVLKTLHLCHFVTLSLVSVSNFRSPILKKILPLPVLLILENIFQLFLSRFMFGPSIFVLAQKLDSPTNP